MASSEEDRIDNFKNSKDLLCSHCQIIVSNIRVQKEEAQDDTQKEMILDVYSESCTRLLEEINDLDRDSKHLTFSSVADKTQKIAQLFLDVTYVDECCLVDHDFLLDTSYQRVSNIIETLSGLEKLASDVVPGHDSKNVLSPSISECIHWRKGALLYMYCHTLYNRLEHQQLPSHFLQCLKDGSKYLVDMLSTRGSPDWLRGGVTSESVDPDPGQASSSGDECDVLLARGIYSDTHLLALMYLGEMCFWHAKITSWQRVTDASESGQCDGEKESSFSEDAGDSFTTKKADGILKHKGERGPASYVQSATVSDVPETSEDAKLSKEFSKLSHENAAFVDESSGSAPSTVDGHELEIVKCARTEPNNAPGSSLDMVDVGKLCLENYVKAAKGPMLAGGWNTDRAEEILQYFESLEK